MIAPRDSYPTPPWAMRLAWMKDMTAKCNFKSFTHANRYSCDTPWLIMSTNMYFHCVASQCLLAGSCCASEGTIQASSLKRSASCAFLAAPAQTLVASVAPAQDKRVVHELSIIEQAWNVTAKPGTNAMKGTLPLRLCEPQSGSMAQVEQPCSELRLAVGVGLT